MSFLGAVIFIGVCGYLMVKSFLMAFWIRTFFQGKMGVEPILMDVNQDGKTDLLIQYSNTVNGGASDGTMILLLNIGNKFVNVLQSTQKNTGSLS